MHRTDQAVCLFKKFSVVESLEGESDGLPLRKCIANLEEALFN